MSRCKICGKEIAEHKEVCEECLKELNLVCMNCGGRNIKSHEDGGFYCDDCGCFMVKSKDEWL